MFALTLGDGGGVGPGGHRGGLTHRDPRAGLSLSLLLSSLKLSDTEVYEPPLRALLGTASHFCEVVVLKLRTSSGEPLAIGRGILDGESRQHPRDRSQPAGQP